MMKGGNAGYQHFILFLQCFEKASFQVSLKLAIIWEMLKKEIALTQREKSVSGLPWHVISNVKNCWAWLFCFCMSVVQVFWKHCGKGDIARNFLLCFLPLLEISAIFIELQIVICELFQFWRV